MLRLPFLLPISLAVLGCGGDQPPCGAMNAPEFGLAMSGEPLSLAFGKLVAGANNDCPDPAAPLGVISLTIGGIESAGRGLITLCVPRPDRLVVETLALGPTGVRLIDLSASFENCSYALDASQPISGTARSAGMCANGTDPQGFSLVIDGSATLRRTCGTVIDNLNVQLQGEVAVAGS
jgi:hypothetical protein